MIEPHQVWVGTMGKGPDGVELNSSYQHRFVIALIVVVLYYKAENCCHVWNLTAQRCACSENARLFLITSFSVHAPGENYGPDVI